jgi:hypothetical protein
VTRKIEEIPRPAKIAKLTADARLQVTEVSIRDTLPFLVPFSERNMYPAAVLRDGNIFETSPLGNCMFEALSHQLFRRTDFHIDIRLNCVQFFRDNSAFFSMLALPDGDIYLDEMMREGVWGGFPELLAFSYVYECTINLYMYPPSVDGTVKFYRIAYRNSVASVFLTYNCSHYNSVVFESLLD